MKTVSIQCSGCGQQRRWIGSQCLDSCPCLAYNGEEGGEVSHPDTQYTRIKITHWLPNCQRSNSHVIRCIEEAFKAGLSGKYVDFEIIDGRDQVDIVGIQQKDFATSLKYTITKRVSEWLKNYYEKLEKANAKP